MPLLEKLVSLVLCQLVHLEEELRRQQSVLLLVESISAFVLSQLLERGLPVCILISVSIATAPISLVFGPRSETIRFFVAFFEQAQVDVKDLFDVRVLILMLRLLFKLAEELLGVRADLCGSPRADGLLNSVPVFAKLTQ